MLFYFLKNQIFRRKIQKNSPGRNRTSFLGLLDPCPNQCTTRDYIYYSLVSIILFYMNLTILIYHFAKNK